MGSVPGGLPASPARSRFDQRVRGRGARVMGSLLGVLLVAAVVAGCSSDDAAAPAPPPPPAADPAPAPPAADAPPASEDEPEPPADDEPAPASDDEPAEAPAPAPEPPPPAPAPAPEGDAAADPSDAYFALDRVLDVSIEIDPADWDTLRNQTRTFEDLMAEIEEYNLSRPFASIYTWFSGTVTIDGETHGEVGVRKKGFLGSMSDTKPSLKLRFDKYVDDQALGGVIERMTLNNSIQDPSMVNTCLSYRVFAATGSPASRCNFATVSVNGKNLGLYVHVEEIKKPFLARHFDSAEGNLYEGTVSDFTPEFRGTIEKKTNEDDDDWSDIDALVAALADPSPAGLEALGEIVDLDRFLSFWATEVLIGHWDGYAGDRNNYHFYREPDGPFVFIPWGVDDTFHLKDDPNPFDNISEPPPSVLALTAIPDRLYDIPEWRAKYAVRLKLILADDWDEDALLATVDRMAAIVARHALPEAAEAAAADTERVRKFILKRRGEILADLSPEPPDWPEPEEYGYEPPTYFPSSGTLDVHFETTWGSNLSANPLEEGTIIHLLLDEVPQPVDGVGVYAGHSLPDEKALLPGYDDTASIIVLQLEEDGSVSGMVLVVPIDLLAMGTRLVIGTDPVAGGLWSIPPGGAAPDSFTPFTAGTLEVHDADTTPGGIIVGRFSGAFGGSPPAAGAGSDGAGEASGPASLDIGLVINEVAAKGDPLDWFELHNTMPDPIALFGFEVADHLTDAGKRVAFPDGTIIEPGAYLQFSLDKDGWPGFALGGDEELGIWLRDGTLVDSVDWEEGAAGEGQSYARLPDATGDFRTTDNPTPAAANQP